MEKFRLATVEDGEGLCGGPASWRRLDREKTNRELKTRWEATRKELGLQREPDESSLDDKVKKPDEPVKTDWEVELPSTAQQLP